MNLPSDKYNLDEVYEFLWQKMNVAKISSLPKRRDNDS